MRDDGDKRGPVHKHAQAGIQGSVEQGPWWCGMEGRGSTRPRSRTLGAAKSSGLCMNATGRHLTTLATRLSGAQPATVRPRMRVSEVVSCCSPRRGGTPKTSNYLSDSRRSRPSEGLRKIGNEGSRWRTAANSCGFLSLFSASTPQSQTIQMTAQRCASR